ncbi:MAG: hypothetical protein J7M32_03820 [Deltaproteobacteria bacterium]|nr:hypothetical protein [Deltaproteobacteria bacterium]
MNEKIMAKVFYTPVQNPEEIRCINVKDDSNLGTINNFIKRIVTKKLKKPSASKPRFSEETLIEFMKKGLDVESEEVKNLFEKLSKYMYGKARAPHKYWCLIVTEGYLFIYHFAPDTAGTFEDGNIKEYIKYLDDSTLLKFIFKLKSESVSSYFEELSEKDIEQLRSKTTDVYGIFDKSGTKGMKKLTGEEPEYEFKGELRLRIRRSEKTDIVVETTLEDLENINSNVGFDFQRGLATIKIDNAPIIELVVDGIKYDVVTGLKKIKYETLGIGEFIEKYKFYKNDEGIREFKDYVVESKRINKPESNFRGKEETIFILGESVDDCNSLINDSFESIRNNFNVAFVELNGFNANYDEVNIGHFTIFAKLKEDKKIKNIESTFGDMISSVSGNLILEKTIHYVGLLVLSEFLKSKGFREKLYQISKRALNDYYLNMTERNIELKEIDKLGIEFKAGIRTDRQGFFDASPQNFSEKLLEKLRRKRKDTVIFFIGINEDTRDFSPIPLSRIRNEFHDDLREHLFQNNVNILLSETVPISEKDGILILALQKNGGSNENP